MRFYIPVIPVDKLIWPFEEKAKPEIIQRIIQIVTDIKAPQMKKVSCQAGSATAQPTDYYRGIRSISKHEITFVYLSFVFVGPLKWDGYFLVPEFIQMLVVYQC